MTKDPKKIIFVLNHIGYGGTERVTFSIMRGLIEKRYICDLFVFRGGDYQVWKDEIPKESKIFDCKINGKTLNNALKIILKLRSQIPKYDIIIGAGDQIPVYFSWLCSQFSTIKCLGWMHTNLEHEFKNSSRKQIIASKIIYPRLDATISVSKGVLNFWQKHLNANPGKKRFIIRNLVDIQNGYPRTTEDKNTHMDAFTKPVVISVGRLSYQKGQDDLIKAHKIVLSQKIDHNLLIVGTGEDEQYLKNLASDIGCKNSVFFTGHIRNPIALIKRSDIFVLSSRFEGFALVLVEALSTGIPVISYNCPNGPSEVLDNGRYGVLVEEGSISALAESIKNGLQGHYKDISLNGYSRANFYSKEKIIPLWEKMFSQVI